MTALRRLASIATDLLLEYPAEDLRRDTHTAAACVIALLLACLAIVEFG